jgi:hypothetical protein
MASARKTMTIFPANRLGAFRGKILTSCLFHFTQWRLPTNVASWQILLQKSKVAELRIFRENTKQEAITDSYNLIRVTEVAYEFDTRR